MADEKTYDGSCHCGAVKYQVDAALDTVVACNCSICHRRGWLLAFIPEDKFRLVSGADAQTEYQFGKKHLHHLFCKTCGVTTFNWGPDKEGKKRSYAVNARTLEGVDATKLKRHDYDGANR